MKILLSVPGDLCTVPMNQFAAEALRALGCEVQVFDHSRTGARDRLIRHCSRAWFNAYKNRKLLEAVRAFKPELFLTVYGLVHGPDVIAEINRLGIRTACWWLNDPFAFAGTHRDFAQIGAFHRYFTNCRGILPDYERAGVTAARFLPVGIDPAVHRPEPTAQTCDVLFAGDWHPLRQQVLESIAADFSVEIVGPWQKRKIGSASPLNRCLVHRGFFTPAQMVAAFNRAKVVFNLHTWYGRFTYGINPRLFEAAGCAAFQLCDAKDEIPDLYVPDREIVQYRALDEVAGLLRQWLPRAEDRRIVAAAARTRTLAEHTYVHRMRQLLGECGFAA